MDEVESRALLGPCEKARGEIIYTLFAIVFPSKKPELNFDQSHDNLFVQSFLVSLLMISIFSKV